jgi:hypothetical protein
MGSPGAGLRAESRVEGSAPGRTASLSGKPRNPDEILHAHIFTQSEALAYSRRPVFRPGRKLRSHVDVASLVPTVRALTAQIIAKAMIISPNAPIAMIVFVVVSIVASENSTNS